MIEKVDDELLKTSTYVTVIYWQDEYKNISNENILDIVNLSKIKDMRENSTEIECPIFTNLLPEKNIDDDDIHIFNINKAKHYLAINIKIWNI